MTTALELNNLHYGYKGNWSWKRTPVLFDINLKIEAGEFFGFLGHSGSGKTTSIKCILSLLKPTKGDVKIFGKDSSESNARASIGYLPEQPYFYDHLSVKETVSMFASLSGISSSDLDSAVDRAISKLGMSSRSKDPLKSLSKGLTQKVAMAQAIVAKPKLLILDEPFSGLDPIGRKLISDLLFELKEQGITIFMSSHILSDVEAVCDRVSIMKKGHLQGVFDINNIPENLSAGKYELVIKDIAKDLPELTQGSLSNSLKGNFLHIQYAERQQAEQSLKEALDQGLTVEKFSFSRPSLEDLFIELVKEGDK